MKKSEKELVKQVGLNLLKWIGIIALGLLSACVVGM